MPLARRKFIASSLVFTASVLFSGNTRLGFARTLIDDGRLSSDVLNDPLYSFTRETFEPYVGDYFEAVNARGGIPLKLVKVDTYVPQPETKISTGTTVKTDSFSLVFSAEAALPEVTSIHRIKHGALGDFSLFLTRQGDSGRGIVYEAVFNRVR